MFFFRFIKKVFWGIMHFIDMIYDQNARVKKGKREQYDKYPYENIRIRRFRW